MTLHVGEDLLSTLAAVLLLSLLLAAVVDYYQSYLKRQQDFEDFNLALNTAETLISGALAPPDKSPGLAAISPERLENFSRILFSRGVGAKVEIRTLSDELLYVQEQGVPWEDSFYLSSSVSLPLALLDENGSVRLCELIVKIWRK